jgi:hypothetical protein
MVELYIMRRKGDCQIALPEWAIALNPNTYANSYDVDSVVEVPEHVAPRLNGKEGNREELWDKLAYERMEHKDNALALDRVMASLGKHE